MRKDKKKEIVMIIIYFCKDSPAKSKKKKWKKYEKAEMYARTTYDEYMTLYYHMKPL